MEIHHLFQFVTGSFETDSGKLICIPHRKYLRVDLCFQGPMHIPFARIVLHSKDLAKDAEQVFDSAAALGKEIARRWNAYEHEAENNPYLARIKELEGWVAEGKRNGTQCAEERDKLQDAVRNLREAKDQKKRKFCVFFRRPVRRDLTAGGRL